MSLLRVGLLPDEPLAAAAHFHAEVLPRALAALKEHPAHLALVFAPADHAHTAWRLAAVQGLAREHAPSRINAMAADDEAGIAAALAYLDAAEGVTGQLLPLDGNGAGEVLYKADD